MIFDEYRFKLQNYTLTKKIGEGTFSTVWVGENENFNNYVAVKILPKEDVPSSKSMTRFNREINLLKSMNHPFILHFYELIEDDKCFYLVLEHVENDNLAEFITRKRKLDDRIALHIFLQLLNGLDYLHNEVKVIHRDLKPENVTLDKNNNIRIIDFGLSKTLSEDSPKLFAACGSPAYVAPEIILGSGYTVSADIWSLGVILYNMVTGELPFNGDQAQLFEAITKKEPDYTKVCNHLLRDLISEMLKKSPEQRITIDKIKNHPWIANNNIYHLVVDIVNSIREESSTINPQFLKLIKGENLESVITPESIRGDRTPEVSSYLQLYRNEMQNQLFSKYHRIREIIAARYAAPSPQFIPYPEGFSDHGYTKPGSSPREPEYETILVPGQHQS